MRRLAILALLVCLGSPTSGFAAVRGSAFDPVDSLELQVFLEDSVFVENQSVEVFVCATNRSHRMIPAIKKPEYFCGYFDFSLIDVETGKGLGRSYFSCGWMYGAYNLAPGASLCSRTQLEYHYGSRRAKFLGQDEPALRPGRYRLSAYYPVRLPQDEHHRQFSLISSPIEFRIDSLALYPGERDLLASFAAEGQRQTPYTTDYRDRCARWLPRFYVSRFFEMAYFPARLRLPQPPLSVLAEDLEGLNGHPFRQAVIADIALRQFARTSDSLPCPDDSVERLIQGYMTESPGPEILSSYHVGPMVTIRGSLRGNKKRR